MKLNADELERYARHIVLREIGGSGQQKLKAAKVLIVGAGGLGAPVIQYLAAAGIGTIGIVDDDVVALSNLQRQVIHRSGDVALPKVESAARFVRELNQNVVVETFQSRLQHANAGDLVSRFDLVIDGCDNFETRYLVADCCEELEKPLVTAAVGRFDASLTVIKPHALLKDGTKAPRYRDIFPQKPPDGMVPSCEEAGILGALTGVVGSMQALEAIKELSGIGSSLIGRLLLYDAFAARFEEIRYRRKE